MVYSRPKGKGYYALDTEKGEWEILNKQGKHTGKVMKFDGEIQETTVKGTSHDLIIK